MEVDDLPTKVRLACQMIVRDEDFDWLLWGRRNSLARYKRRFGDEWQDSCGHFGASERRYAENPPTMCLHRLNFG